MEDFWQSITEIWLETRGDPRVCIALLDGRVDQTHPSLRGANLTEVDLPFFPDSAFGSTSRHGTHVASIIFGQHDGPIPGIAPACRGLLIPIFKDSDDPETLGCSETQLAEGISTALAAGAQVINISAGQFSPLAAPHPDLELAIARCARAGVLVAAAAGNHGRDTLQVPSSMASVLAVGALSAQGKALPSSNWSPVDEHHLLFAPGEAVVGAIPGGGVTVASGTSYAAAIVSGVSALLLSVQLLYGETPDGLLVRDVLMASSTHAEEGNGTDHRSYNRLDARAALHLLKEKLGNEPGTVVASRSMQLDSYPSSGHGTELHERHSVLSPRALKDRYQNVPAEKFGSVDIVLPNGRSYNVQDLHYHLDQDRVGMRIIPVNDQGYIALPNGTSLPGYELIDRFLRRDMQLAPTDPIYALVGWIRPEEHRVDLCQLPYTTKIRMGYQHLAAYRGEGKTTHVLPRKTDWQGDGPLNMKWNVDRYPANVHVISLHGVSQSILNRNAHIVDNILVPMGRSPEDTDRLWCRTIDINTTLQFYRDTILRAEYLHDLSWFVNCAVHKTIVVNVLLNVPHNEHAFQEIFGRDGAAVWGEFKRRYKEVTGEAFGPDRETYFTPLWKLAGLTAEEIRPLSVSEYFAFDAARAEGWLDEYPGRKPLEPGRGLAWRLETAVDLVGNVVNTYVSSRDAGVLAAAVVLLLLRHVARSKLNVPEELYLGAVRPIITKLIVAHSLPRGAHAPRSLESAASTIRAGVERCEGKNLVGSNSPIEATIDACLEAAKAEIATIPEDEVHRLGGADEWLRRALGPDLDALRMATLTGHANLGYFSSPSIIHQIAEGVHPKSPFVRVRTVCTVMGQAELVLGTPHGQPNVLASVPVVQDVESHASARHERELQEEDRNTSTADVALGQQSVPAVNLSPQPLEVSSISLNPDENDGVERVADKEQSMTEDPSLLVYALGKIGYDLVSPSRRDSIKQKMDQSAHPEDPEDLLRYLEANPYDAAAIQWTLDLEQTPIYAIEPRGPFARDAFELLRQFLREQLTEGVERVSIPGEISGTIRLRSGQEIPVVVPVIRGMYSWTTGALVEAVSGPAPGDDAAQKEREEYGARRAAVTNFLDRVYYEIRNPGRAPQDRALNYAATNAFEVEKVFQQAIREEMELDTIAVERSPVGPPTGDCWDVKLVFFFPQRPTQTTRRVYRFTIDVADPVPSTISPVRSWSIR